jgi:hypothetical protein
VCGSNPQGPRHASGAGDTAFRHVRRKAVRRREGPFFDSAAMSPENLLGEVGSGLEYLKQRRPREALDR